MIEPRHATVTTAWIILNLTPLIAIILVGILYSPLWGFILFASYVLLFVPYGFFVAMPIMVKLFRKPASVHKRE
jgi:hypothetical protein